MSDHEHPKRHDKQQHHEQQGSTGPRQSARKPMARFGDWIPDTSFGAMIPSNEFGAGRPESQPVQRKGGGPEAVTQAGPIGRAQLQTGEVTRLQASGEQPATDEAEPMTMADYLQIVSEVEAHYRQQAEAAGQTYDPNTTVAAMRALYGYEGGNWERMIPDAPNVAAPTAEQIPSLARLSPQHLVRLPNGETLDPGHIYTGIDAVQHPDVDWRMDAAGIRGEDGATWAGDVGSAIVGRDENPTTYTTADAAMRAFAGPEDLHADLDGVVLGHRFDATRSLTGQMRDYYLGPQQGQGYLHRYSQFASARGLSLQDGALSESAQETIRDEVDDFADLYASRNSGFLGRAGGGLFGNYNQGNPASTDMTDRFIGYVNDGLASEPPVTLARPPTMQLPYRPR